MSTSCILLNLINDNNFKEYELLIENNKNVIFFYTIETQLLVRCIEKDRIHFFEKIIDSKSSIYYFNFIEVIREIIKKDCIDYYKSIFSIKNINSYISFESIVDLSIDNNKYNIIKYIINNNIFDFNCNSYIYYIKLLIKINNLDIIKFFIDKILKNKYNHIKNKQDTYLINLNCYFSCDDKIFEYLFDIILDVDKYYLINLNYNRYIDKKPEDNFNIFKFNYIYDKLNIVENKNLKWFKDISIYNCFQTNNIELLEQLVDKFNYSNDEILTIIKKYKKIKNNRNLIDLIINKFTMKPSYYLYNKNKDFVVSFNINNLICISIENNNILILENLDTDIENKSTKEQINIKKIENYVLRNHINKVYIHLKTFNTLFEKFNLLKNINFSVDYMKLLLDNNEKESIINLIDIIYTNDLLYDVKYIKTFEKKIKSYITSIIIKRLKDCDIYDWIFIDWVDSKLINMNILESSIKCIKNNILIYEPNIHFVYWHLNRKTELLDAEFIDELLIYLHKNFNILTEFMINNIHHDHILNKMVKDILSRDKHNTTKQDLLNSIFTKHSYDSIMKLENVDSDMKQIFETIYNDKYTVFQIFKYSLNSLSYEVLNYLMNKLNKLKLNSVKSIVSCIVDKKNYYFMNKITELFGLIDRKKLYHKLLTESIKSFNIIIFKWTYDKLKDIANNENNANYEYEIQKNIQELLEKNTYATYKSISLKVYNFHIDLLKYLSYDNKYILYKKMIEMFYDNKELFNEFLRNHIKFENLTYKQKYDFLKTIISMIEECNIEICIEILNITKEDYEAISVLSTHDINSNDDYNDIICDSFEYNLLYNHSFKFIKYLHDMGLQLHFSNEIVSSLFDTTHFNRCNDLDVNNVIILELLYNLSDINLFKIDVNTLNLFLENYDDLKYKITVSDIKKIIEKYDIKCDYDLFSNVARSNTKELFDYLYELEKIDLRQNEENLFLKACVNNDIKFAKYLLELDPTIDVSIKDDAIFSECCNNDSLDVIKWLYEIIPNISIIAKHEHSICGACYYGHIDTTRWLMENIEGIDIKVDDDYCMINAVDREFHFIVTYIMEIEPERYNIVWGEGDEIDNIVNFSINKTLLIEDSTTVDEIIECPICYENNTSIVTCCGHQYCYNCFNEYYKRNSNINCPYCRKENIKLFNIVNTDA